MFELESKEQRIVISTKQVRIDFNVVEAKIDAGLELGAIRGPGEFEIGDVMIRGIRIDKGQTIYDAEVGGVHVGIIGDIEDGLDDLGMADVLCTSSVRAIREIEPRLVVAMGNLDAMVAELKLVARSEKKLKIKNADSLPVTMEVVTLT